MFLDMAAVETSEESLIRLAQHGDRDAFHDLVIQHHAGTINVVFRMCGDANLAEDAAQTAFIRAWQHLPQYKPQASFRSWLYRIAVNAALDILRSEKPTINLEELVLGSAAQPVEHQVEQQQQTQILRKAVLALPDASRAVLVLREYEGLSYQEISDTLDIPIGTVMSRLNYARKSLVEQLRNSMEAA
ncbi:MAG: hypothetical protein CVU39_11540 [Chloroflexi bacterium HGW-Chloroflexi-10]|nr:MAG: hypothetical protein CVU39_11540 [Chloroflexi bacterium HGW-Chloroflexi-10]